MNGTPLTQQQLLTQQHYLSKDAGDFAAFVESVSHNATLTDYPQASNIEQNAVVYSRSTVTRACSTPEEKKTLMAEWIKVWTDGPGVLMITQAMDHQVIDRANETFERIINQQKADGGGSGDHFAKAGANDRIWNALEKHGKGDPENFTHYYANEAIALASEAWLGAGYQITAQVNRVNPGSAAQSAHRDYHLGFMAEDQILKYPMHVHQLSPALTLQGAIAHCDMPLASGPTLYLPYSQHFSEGYVAFTRDEFQQYFNKHRSQLELKKGDMVFFNPALMHAAGENKTADIYRLANLLQVSSAFGRAMESIDHLGLIDAIYPTLVKPNTAGTLTKDQIVNVISACADGYPFPTNLDTDLPAGGMAPKTQQQYLLEALDDNTNHEILLERLQSLTRKQSLT